MAGSEWRVQWRRRWLRRAGLPWARASAEGVIKVLGLEAGPALAAAAGSSAMRGAVRRAGACCDRCMRGSMRARARGRRRRVMHVQGSFDERGTAVEPDRMPTLRTAGRGVACEASAGLSPSGTGRGLSWFFIAMQQRERMSASPVDPLRESR